MGTAFLGPVDKPFAYAAERSEKPGIGFDLPGGFLTSPIGETSRRPRRGRTLQGEAQFLHVLLAVLCMNGEPFQNGILLRTGKISSEAVGRN